MDQYDDIIERYVAAIERGDFAAASGWACIAFYRRNAELYRAVHS